MSSSERKPLTYGQMDRCDVRLENDSAALEAVARKSDRLQVTVNRFGKRVFEIELCFPQVRTAFLDTRTQEVVVKESKVLAKIRPNAGNAFPYPMGAPNEVRIQFPGLTDSCHIPWLGGLAWLSEHMLPDSIHQSAPPMFREMLQMMLASGDLPIGIPCLWRSGEWDLLNCDLIFVAQQIHRMLSDPRDYSPNDAMNREAALYWATHRDQLPLEPPIPELQRSHPDEQKTRSKVGFALKEIE